MLMSFGPSPSCRRSNPWPTVFWPCGRHQRLGPSPTIRLVASLPAYRFGVVAEMCLGVSVERQRNICAGRAADPSPRGSRPVSQTCGTSPRPTCARTQAGSERALRGPQGINDGIPPKQRWGQNDCCSQGSRAVWQQGSRASRVSGLAGQQGSGASRLAGMLYHWGMALAPQCLVLRRNDNSFFIMLRLWGTMGAT